MASIIKIKRSGTTGGAPGTLGNGELAYSYLAGTQANGGDRVYIGVGTETGGNAADRHVIGGKYFTDMLSHVKGVLTSESALITDTDNKLNQIKVDNLDLNGATIATYNFDTVTPLTDININFDPLGNGTLRVIPPGAGTYEALVVDDNDIPNKAYVDSEISAVNSLVLEDEDLADPQTIAFGSDKLQITGGEGIDTVVSRGVAPNDDRVIMTISAEIATSGANLANTNLGVASFNSTNFTVTSGFVESNDITIGTTALTLGESTTTLAGLTQVDVDNVRIFDNTITSTNTDGNLVLDANGTGNIDVNSNKIINLADPTNNLDAVNYQTLLTAVGDISTLVVRDDGVNNIEVLLTEDILVFTGGDGINVTASNAVGGLGGTSPETITFTIDADIATAGTDAANSTLGIASFNSTNFTVTNGFVESNNITIGSTALTLGGTSTTLAGLTQVTIDEIDIDGNAISAVGAGTDINIVLTPKGTGTIDVSSAKITSLANPTQAQDAANKAYVDSVLQGLDIKESVRVATTVALTVTASGSGPGKTLTNAGTQASLAIDGVNLSVGNRVLVKDQDGGNSVDNGIYVVTDLGSGVTNWILTRAEDADGSTLGSVSEVTAGMFVFVEEGTVNGDNGFVLTTNDPITIDTTALSFTQFTGAGQVIAGDGLTKSGNRIDAGQGDGILITADHINVNTSIAGDGLTATVGGTLGGATALNVVGTADRISVTADAVDIASTYVGQTSITTLGTITAGTWNGSVVAVTYGGTGLSTVTSRGIPYGNGTSALGVTAASAIDGSFLKEDSSGAPFWSNVIDGGEY